jgi:hypothetical protein
MAAQPLFDQVMPSPDEIQAAIRRAHHERSQALRRILVTLFSRRKVSVLKPEHTRGLDVAAWR